MAGHRRHMRREVPVLGSLAPNVLVVDNNVDSAEAFKNFLESAGHRLCIEPRGEEKTGVSIIGSAPQLRLS
jgi:hypothetical protein